MNAGQAILFTVIGGLVALVVAGIIAALIASAIRRSTQRQFDNQLKAQKDLYEEQVLSLIHISMTRKGRWCRRQSWSSR